MASDKQRKKTAKAKRAADRPPPAGPFRHPDGDRRRRERSVRVEDAIAAKRMLQGRTPHPDDRGDERE